MGRVRIDTDISIWPKLDTLHLELTIFDTISELNIKLMDKSWKVLSD